jgi:hypothetical protein
MKSAERPEAYGVFKPVGHVIVAFPDDESSQAALAEMLRSGFTASDIVAYTPQQMKEQADIDIDQAGLLAGIGQELNLVKAHRELAVQGHHFLVVHAPDDDDSARVAEIAQRFNAARAQKYGRLFIEELIEPGTGARQVAESPDRGLDAQTRSGNEPSVTRY